jgi:hypothetical protein
MIALMNKSNERINPVLRFCGKKMPGQNPILEPGIDKGQIVAFLKPLAVKPNVAISREPPLRGCATFFPKVKLRS